MLNILNESKLSTKDRDKLDSSIFGLPKERQYPLTDDTHVRKAIQFFKFCPAKNKNELANNINKRLKELNMTVKIGEDNPFSKYADKNMIVTEASLNISIPPFIDYKWINPSRLSMMSTIFNKQYSSMAELNELELSIDRANLYEEIVNDYDRYDCRDKTPDNPIDILNSIIDAKYGKYIEYMDYENESNERLLYDIVNDIFKSISYKMEFRDKDINDEIKILNNILSTNIFNRLYLTRKINGAILEYELYEKYHYNNSISELYEKNKKAMTDMKNLISVTKGDASYSDTKFSNIFDDIINHSSNILNTSIMNFLNSKKEETEKQLYIINGYLDDSSRPNPIEYNDLINGDELLKRLFILDYKIRCERLRCSQLKHINFYLDEIRLLRVQHIVRNKNIQWYIIHDVDSNPLYVMIYDNKLHLVGVNELDYREIFSIELDNSASLLLTSYTEDSRVIKISKLTANENIYNVGTAEKITEGLSIDKDGNIKFVLSPKYSYMNEYMMNHRLLMVNYKNKNWKGVKDNLAMAFLLISVIESGERTTDSTKARAFLINDFKTYLAKVQSAEPNFNFESYYRQFYEKAKYDKIIINIPTETITGFKKLLSVILA